MRNQGYGSSSRRRVMIFIDGSNLYHVLRQNIDKRDLDYKKFAEKLCGDRELIRTYYYNIRQESPDNPGLASSQDRFLNALYETDYLEVKLGIWKQRGNTMVEKGVDVMIASDLIAHAYEDHYDTAILVSGDADFYPALQVVKDTGKQVEVAAFDSNLSSEAARFSDVLIKFDRDYFDDLWMSASQKSSNFRAAEKRKLVTDEAASPNGEDKGGNKGATNYRKPFTERYADRRNAYSAASSNSGSNGNGEAKQTGRGRRTETRRSLASVLQARPKSTARTERRGLAVGSRRRQIPSDQHSPKGGGSDRSLSDVPSPVTAGTADGARDQAEVSDRGDARRETWISRMFGSRS